MPSSEITSSDYWNTLYQKNETGWDIGYPSPPIAEYVDQLKNRNISILMPGCGNAYEAEYLMEKNFTDVTLVDIASDLTRKLSKHFEAHVRKGLIKIITGDFFQLQGSFDLILEQTFLSALPPSLRTSYASKMYELLKPGGQLVGVLFSKLFDEEGPPFGATIDTYKDLFSEWFEIKAMAPCYNSIDRRMGAEAFINLIKSN